LGKMFCSVPNIIFHWQIKYVRITIFMYRGLVVCCYSTR